jgi:drug/metabolite transporter (DMT)-like permease
MLAAVLFFFIIVVGTGGEMCISYAMKGMGEIHDFRPGPLLRFVSRALRLPWTWAGIALMALAFFSLVAILSFEQVSFVVPFTALSYVVGALGSRLFLKERISPLRWLGIVVVAIGVTLVWFSKH